MEESETKVNTNIKTTCRLCRETIVGSVLTWVADCVIPNGALTEHYKECSWISHYNKRL